VRVLVIPPGATYDEKGDAALNKARFVNFGNDQT
jgi:hypothetical protein